MLFVSLGFIFLDFVGYSQSELKGKICFYFIDQYGYFVTPQVKIVDSEGNLFKLSTDYCFDYSTPFDIIVSDANYYEYQKIYCTPIPETDTIVLSNMIASMKFFFTSETPILTNDEIKYFQNFISNNKYHFFSLSLVINNIRGYEMSEFQNAIAQIYDLYISNFFSKKFHNTIDFSVFFEKDNLNIERWIEDYNSEKIYYFFHCEAITANPPAKPKIKGTNKEKIK